MFNHMKIRLLLGLSIIGFIGFVVIAIFSTFFGADEGFIATCLSIIMYIVVPFIFFYHYYRKEPFSLKQVVFFSRSAQWVLPICAIVVVAISFSLSTFWLTLFTIEPILPILVDFLMEEVPFPTNPFYLFFEILVISVLAPIVEEFFFRGVILHRIMLKTSMWGGILISSLLFGILHSDIIGAFFFGVIACLLYLRTGNLLLPIMMHILNNTIAVVLSFVPTDWLESVLILSKEDITGKAFPISIMLVVSTLLTIFITVKLGKGLGSMREGHLTHPPEQ